MALKDYVPNSDASFCALLTHVVTILPQYYAVLGISAATPQIGTLVADEAAYKYLCVRQVTLRQAAEGARTERDRIRFEDPASPGAASNMSYPTAPAVVPSPVLPGLEGRFRRFVHWLRALPGYDAAIGEALHVVGADSTLPDPATLKPQVRLQVSGGQVEVLWNWDGSKPPTVALELQVDRGAGAVFLAVDTRPNYTDMEPLPAAAAKWRYRGIWHGTEGRIGQWSDWVEIVVSA